MKGDSLLKAASTDGKVIHFWNHPTCFEQFLLCPFWGGSRHYCWARVDSSGRLLFPRHGARRRSESPALGLCWRQAELLSVDMSATATATTAATATAWHGVDTASRSLAATTSTKKILPARYGFITILFLFMNDSTSNKTGSLDWTLRANSLSGCFNGSA